MSAIVVKRLLLTGLLGGACIATQVHARPEKQADISPQDHSWGSAPVSITLLPNHLIYNPSTAYRNYTLSATPPQFGASINADVLTLTFGNGPTPGPVAVGFTAEDEGEVVTFDFTVTVTNGAPTAAAMPDLNLLESEADQGFSVGTAGYFDDPDWLPGSPETVTLRVAGISDVGLLAWDAAPVAAGGNLGFTLMANQNGTAVVTVEAEDRFGAAATTSFNVLVGAVNDEPVVLNPIGLINTFEDNPVDIVIDLSDVFHDVDSDTNGEVLMFDLRSISNPGLFDIASVTGSIVTLSLAPDQNGLATIVVEARDPAGAAVSDTFRVDVAVVNDIPVANDDNPAPIDEDSGPITIAVLENDYLAEEPTIIAVAGVNGESEGVPPTVLDPFGDPVQLDSGTVTISGNQIQYQPAENFFGTDFFTYVLEDGDGDRSAPATVAISVLPANDPPVGIQERTFNMLENGTLVIDALSGALTGHYDVDGALLDGSGNPVGSPISAVLSAPLPPGEGNLSWNNATGAFTYVPPINFTGVTFFEYRLFDGEDLSEGTDYRIRVVVNPAPPPPVLPNPGQVAATFDVANVPLEQASVVPPNVMIIIDDSGSMNWNMIVSGGDQNGGFPLDNAEVVGGGGADVTTYVYLWDLPTNTYPPRNFYGYVLATQGALNDGETMDNEYGVWRARNHRHNTLYYNPQIQYRPWIGQDANNEEFTNANASAIRLDPVDPTNAFDLLTPHSYESANVPIWSAGGGTTNVDVTVYIPHYYTTDSVAPLPAVDPTAQIVEIRPGGAYEGGPGREDCAGDGDPLTCTYDEEIQNFANWFQYYRSREHVTKSAIGGVVADSQDIRVGYETINAVDRLPIRPMNELHTEGDKKLLLDDVYGVGSTGGTPLRRALSRAGGTFQCQRGECPRLPAPDGQCQQNFALLFTDGYWNGNAGVSTNDDIDGPREFDGGRYQDDVRATLADTAMFYYENDLHPDYDDEVPVTMTDANGVPPRTFPDINATMHQHMKTWVVAFGLSGTFDPGDVPLDPTEPFAWSDPFDGPREKIDDLVHAAVNGRGRYLSAQNPQELQSALETAFLEFTQTASSSSAAAFNSTSLRTGTFLYRGFYDLRDNTGELTATLVNPADGSLAAMPSHWASRQLNDMLPGNRQIVTSDPLTGDGILFRFANLAPSQQAMMSNAEVEFIRGDRSNEGIVFRERPLVDGLLGDIVNSSPVFVGAPRAINRDQEPYPENDLYSDFAQGHQSRQAVVYVGANDGMLHGFDAANLSELFGYVPNKIIDTGQRYHNDLDEVPSPFYQHRYYVDLTPSLNDVYMRPSRSVTGKQWITFLLGGLGGGGKGFFALNVTDPDVQFISEVNAADSVLWEFTDEDDTYPVDAAGNPIGGGTWVDPDGLPVKDLGMALSQPTVAMSNVSFGGAPAQQEWIAVFGNGINSTAGIAKLFVLFIDQGLDGWGPGDFVKLDTGAGVPIAPAALTGFPNGLGTVTAVDIDLNGTADWVYGGDRMGNLYRFDISAPDPDRWTATLLFTASYTDGSGNTTVQPILAKPVVSKHPTQNGFLVTFGTGSHVSREDARAQDIQSIYTIWDRGETNPPTAQPNSKQLRLVQQVITNVVDDSASPFTTRRIVSENLVNYESDGASPGTYGWYVDFDMERAAGTISGAANPDASGQAPPLPQFPGEKAIRRMIFRGGNILATTVLPTSSGTSCFGTRPGSLLLLNALTGGNPLAPFVDFNNDSYVDDGDLVNVDGRSYVGGILFDSEDLDGSLVDPSILGGEGEMDVMFLSGGTETLSFQILDVNDNRTGRLSWLELM